MLCLYADNRSGAEIYHPGSLLGVSKIFGKLVNNRLTDHLEICGLLPDLNYSFRYAHSTVALLTGAAEQGLIQVIFLLCHASNMLKVTAIRCWSRYPNQKKRKKVYLPYSQVLWIKRICFSQLVFLSYTMKMINWFQNHGYRKVINWTTNW